MVAHLRGADATVEELAAALSLTDNAVRAHLATLERDGFVRAAGVRREGSVGKPATVYTLTAEAEPALSAAYAPVLRALLAALPGRIAPRSVRALMRDVGRRLAGGKSSADGALRRRAEAGAAALNELGGSATVHASGDGYRIQGCGCPLSDAVRENGEVCSAVETMLAELTGADVRRQCEHGERPQCRFEVSARAG